MSASTATPAHPDQGPARPTTARKAVIARLKRGLGRALPDGWDNGLTDAWHVWAPYLLMQDLREFADPHDRTPDVLVRPSVIESSGPRRGRHAFGAPVLGIDVVPAEESRGNLTTKLSEYADLGLPRFWHLDLDHQVLRAFALADGVYREEAQLDDDNPVASLETGAGTVRISLVELLTDHSGDDAARGRASLLNDPTITSTFSSSQLSWDDYECYLADGPRQNYFGGTVFARRSPLWEERVTISRLRDAIGAALPSHLRLTRNAVWKAGPTAFAPDLMVVPTQDVDAFFILDVPELVVEVVNGNCTANTVVKVQQYARAGAPRYWIIDVRDRLLLCLDLLDDAYRVTTQLDDQNPDAELDTGAGTLRISLPDLFEQPLPSPPMKPPDRQAR